MTNEAQERIQRELDRLGLQVGQKFSICRGNLEGFTLEVNCYGALLYRAKGCEARTSSEATLILEPEDITWREFTQPDWSEEFKGWCKFVEDCWIVSTKPDCLRTFESEPKWTEEGLSLFIPWDYISTFTKPQIISELNNYLQENKNGTIIQIVDGKPYLRQVINGEIQED